MRTRSDIDDALDCLLDVWLQHRMESDDGTYFHCGGSRALERVREMLIKMHIIDYKGRSLPPGPGEEP